MRRLALVLCLSMLGACGGGGDLPTPLDGTWNAAQTVAGATIGFVLKEQNNQLVGAGTYRIGTANPGAIAVAGARSGPAVTLELVYDNGTRANYVGLVNEATRMSGALSIQGGATATVDFLRQ